MFYAAHVLGELRNPFAHPVAHAFADEAARDSFVAAANAPMSAYEAAPISAGAAARYAASRPMVRHD